MSLFSYEWSKIIKNKTVIGALVVSLIISGGIFFIGYNYSQNHMSQTRNSEKGYSTIDNKINMEYTGDLTDGMVKKIVNDYVKLTSEELKDKGFASGEGPFYLFYWEVAQTFLKMGPENLSTYLNELLNSGKEVTESNLNLELNSVDSIGFKTFHHPLKFGNYIPWSDFFRVIGNLFILCNLLVVFICSLLFSNDTSTQINQLLFSTKLGRTKLNIAKIGVGNLISVLLFFFFQILNFVVFSAMFDINGGSSNIQTNLSMNLFHFPMDWNHWQVYAFIVGLQLTGLLFTASITTFVSSMAKSPMAAFSVSLGLFFLPYFLKELIKTGIVNELLYLFPMNFASPNQILSILSSDNFIFNSFLENSALIIISLLVVKIIAEGMIYLRMKAWRYA